MCMVAVYLQQSDGSVAAEPAFEDVAQLECKDGEIIITPLLAPAQSIRGQVRSVDLLGNTVIIETDAETASDSWA